MSLLLCSHHSNARDGYQRRELDSLEKINNKLKVEKLRSEIILMKRDGDIRGLWEILSSSSISKSCTELVQEGLIKTGVFGLSQMPESLQDKLFTSEKIESIEHIVSRCLENEKDSYGHDISSSHQEILDVINSMKPKQLKLNTLKSKMKNTPQTVRVEERVAKLLTQEQYEGFHPYDDDDLYECTYHDSPNPEFGDLYSNFCSLSAELKREKSSLLSLLRNLSKSE
jgi:hypothetical protein